MTPADALLIEAAELRARAEAAEAEARRLQAQEREDAIVAALGLYLGSLYARASALGIDLKKYSVNGWRREFALDDLPDSAPVKRRAWHRVLRSRQGEPLAWRQIYNIGAICNRATVTLQKSTCESRLEAQ